MLPVANVTSSTQPSLLRVIGRLSLTAAIVNGVIGSGVFGLPSAVAALTGAWSPLAVLIAGACVFVVLLCFAEVGSRFDDAGGPYLYARDAFGPSWDSRSAGCCSCRGSWLARRR